MFLNKRNLCFTAFFFLLIESAFCQVPSVIEHIRIPVWAVADAYPELELKDDSGAYKNHGTGYDYAVSEIKKIAPFLIQGMVYGWNFVYTPQDSARGVKEYFELTEIHPLDVDTYNITYESPWIFDNKLQCWCEYSRTEVQVQNYYYWATIKNPKIQGRGYGSLSKGFEGIKDACMDAVKNAVREYYRQIIKNKPKEIEGSVLIRSQPQLGIDAGRYMINLDFFLECGTINEYTRY